MMLFFGGGGKVPHEHLNFVCVRCCFKYLLRTQDVCFQTGHVVSSSQVLFLKRANSHTTPKCTFVPLELFREGSEGLLHLHLGQDVFLFYNDRVSSYFKTFF